MASNSLNITMTCTARLMKFDEGKNPEIDEPSEIIDQNMILRGAEAQQFLKVLGVHKDGID